MPSLCSSRSTVTPGCSRGTMNDLIAGAALRLVQRRPHHDVGGARTGGDEDLLAVDHVLVAVQRGGRRHRRRVRPEPRFGDGHRGPHLAQPFQLLVGGHGGDGGVAQALIGDGQHHRRRRPSWPPSSAPARPCWRRCGCPLCSSLPRNASAPAKLNVLRGSLEQTDQSVQFDRVGVFLQVVLAGDRPHHLRDALMRLGDHRLQLAGQLQIDCHD